jgi:hypothetical protein
MAVFSSIAAGIAAASSTIGTIGTAVSIAGTAAGVAGQLQQAAGQRKAQNASKRAEALREAQMRLDSDRKRRETIRQAQIARANALATTTAQGANGEGSSALAGAIGSLSGEAGRNISAINSNETLGADMFQANRDSAEGSAMAAAGGTISSLGSGFASLGNQLVTKQKETARIGGRT